MQNLSFKAHASLMSFPSRRAQLSSSEFSGFSAPQLPGQQITPPHSPTSRKLTTAEEDELLELYRALPQNKQFEFIGELKGFLKAYTESQKYLDKEKRLSV